PPGPPESFGIGKMGETAPKEAVGCILDASHDGKKEILAQYPPGRILTPIAAISRVGAPASVLEAVK
ncbi:MAG: hypothetical protein ABSG25_05980, partial [Bryobacteraceae bacterium]